jgi:hypothetical protein
VARQLTYRDAIEILGAGNSRTIDAIDKLLGGAIITAAAVTGNLEIAALMHVRDELVTRSQKLLAKFGQRVRGANGRKRADLLVAAHTVIAINAYFRVLKEAGLPIDPDRLELRKKDQLRFAGASSTSSSRKLVDALISAPVPLPSAHLPFEQVSARMQSWYRGISHDILSFATGLSVWDELGETNEQQFALVINQLVPELAKDKYEESYRRRAADCIEFQIWANAIDNMATRYAIQQLGNDVDRSFSGLSLELTRLATTPSNIEGPKRLSRAYKSQLERPIVEAAPGETHVGLNVPLLRDAYINPTCLVAECGPEDRPSEESWWSRSTKWSDVQWFLGSYLTSPGATQAPLLLLGQPGSGKSLLTKILAARLPDDEFMPIRVELRRVPADASLDDQIEAAVRETTGEHLEWSELVRGAGDALPVLMLDGFDELLQSTGISHSDYLERVREFQRREMDNDRRVAVLVTSRTVVADRVRVPRGTIAVKLEPFSGRQIDRWLGEWNRINSEYFTGSGLRALDVDVVMRHAELAQQPLLLMMLAFYDADGNLLQQQSGRIGQSELYERLLDKFITREIAKGSPGATEDEVQTQLNSELTQLSIAALAMFNRGRQFVTEGELESDLLALTGENPRHEPGGASFGRRLPPARLVLGRFFFIHESQANIDFARFATYEFLHATFGEYLVARIVFATLKRTIAVRAAEGIAMSFSDKGIANDDRLYALLSFALLTDRLQIGTFLGELIGGMAQEDRVQLSSILKQLFQHVLISLPGNQYATYRPRPLSVPARYSVYSANLLVLNTLASGDAAQASEIFGQLEPLDEWCRIASLWQSQLDASALDGLIKSIQIDRVSDSGGSRDLTISFSPSGESSQLIDVFANLSWALRDHISTTEPAITDLSARISRIISIAGFLCSDDLDMLLHALYPLLKRSARGVGLVMSTPEPGLAVSAANALISMFYEQLDEPDRGIIDEIMNPWLNLLRHRTYGVGTNTMETITVDTSLATLRSVSDVFLDTNVGGSFNMPRLLRSVGSMEYWATILSGIARRGVPTYEGADDLSSPEFVKNVLEQVDPVRIARDEPEAAADALKVARLYDLVGWSADKGLSILALMPREQLAVVAQLEVEFVLERAGRNGVPSAAIEAIHSRWRSAAGAIESGG